MDKQVQVAVQVQNFILNHKGEVWCMKSNELIYSSSYEDALEFLNNLKFINNLN